MLGSLNLNDRRITVVGAGFAGLLLAYTLDRQGYEVTLLEASKRAGGLIDTVATELGPVELAAHSFPLTSSLQRLCDDVGITLVHLRDDSRAKYVFRGGRARKFPLSPLEAASAFARAYLVPANSASSSGEATMRQWTERHLGHAALDALMAPLLTGIYAADPSEITVGAAFPSFAIPRGHSLLSFLIAKKLRSIFGKPASRPTPLRRPIVAPERGMGSLVQALEARLEKKLGSRFRKGETMASLDSFYSKGNIALCVPAQEAARLLEDQDMALAARLRAIPYSPMVSATVFAPTEIFSRPPRGLGILIAPSENRASLGVLFNSSAFPGRVLDERTWVSLTVMLGGSARPELCSASEEELSRWVRRELGEILPTSTNRASWSDPRVHVYAQPIQRAIPQYGGAILQAWQAARQGWCRKPGRILFGNYTGQVSLRGMITEIDNMRQLS